ncbi:MAG: lytic murein transglycosylase, partial [Rhizorhabdus sp.]|nr:lytic murein transglycosylase [Rhizorhabdus sp.]
RSMAVASRRATKGNAMRRKWREFGLAVIMLGSLPGLASAQEAQPEPIQASDDAAQVSDTPAPAVPVISAEDAGLQAFLVGLRPRALALGIDGALYDRVAPTLTFNARVIRFDRSQPGGNPTSTTTSAPDFAPYAATHVDAVRINMGRSRYTRLRPVLTGIERRTGVPEQIMLAIFGHESGYGSFTGNFDLLRSLASLAYEGRRRELFSVEFLNAMLLLQRGVPRETLKGSWAGATGYPQFLPSVYLRLAIDGDGDGKADIWNNEVDTLASIGNYLHDAGWKPDTPWGVAVRLPDAFDRTAVAPLLKSATCPRVHARHSRWLTIAEWRALGVMMVGNPVPREDELAMLIEPDGPGKTGYLITTNFRSILGYNCSNFYALSVGLLGDAIRN